jgi:sarcosine oxidase subunit gamma
MAKAFVSLRDAGAKIRIQCWHRRIADVEALGQHLGAAWPRKTGEVWAGRQRVLCVAPTEWLLVAARSQVESILSDLQPAALAGGLTFTDVSAALRAFALEGAQARDILAKGCGLDLHHREFPANHCARTRLAHVPALIDCVSNVPQFDCYVPRSYEHHFDAWLDDANLSRQPRSVLIPCGT